jgi:hypothetical protein
MSELGSDGSNVTFNPQKTATIKNGANQNDSPFQEIQANINVNEIKDGLNAKDANNENLSQHSSVQYVFDSKKINELIASNAEMKESIKDMSSSINNMTKSKNEMIGSNVETRNVMKEAVDEMKKNNFNQKQLLGILLKRLFPEKKNLTFPLQPQNLNQTQPIIQPQLAQSQVIQITMQPQNPINF